MTLPRVLIAGVGYRNLTDLSLGPLLVDRLQQAQPPAHVEVEDFSYGPIGIMHALDERPPYDRIIFVTSVKRNRPPGEVSGYRWDGVLPDMDEVQTRVAEAIGGVVYLENLLIIATYFKKLPEDVQVLEIEPAVDTWGEFLSPQLEAQVPQLIERIRRDAGWVQ